MSKEFRFLVAIFSFVFLLSVAIVVFSEDPARQNKPLTEEKLTCYEGILYFNTRYTYLSGVVIDSATLQPTRCTKN